ncbi:hypothetical protein JOB18_036985 [Solea senegalensis]|uniref:Uncharacterized protein n=1 Tax=Solea senegalensis TaxID=28829 RepID=A0AAV6Q7Y3_SOLSE|nr:hypothetical protein JOB18_036985 [Solea senegalensis]
MATGIKYYMSSILHRPDSLNTSISPDASTLRKLVRDRNCRPVLRGILESLLHYLMEDLPKWSTRNGNLGKPGTGTISIRNKGPDGPGQRMESSLKQTQFHTNSTMDQLYEAYTPKTTSMFLKHSWLNPPKGRLPSRCENYQIPDNVIPRRLTAFQLLQSKFLRSTPKPPVTHQREVGTLSFNRGVAAEVTHKQGSEHSMHRKDRAKRGQKRGGSVKDMVAKFVMAEQKEGAVNMLKKEPVKPRTIGRGIILNVLMERFETMAIVCKGSDLKGSQKRSSGGIDKDVTGSVKQRVACYKKGQQQVVDQTLHKQSTQKQIECKSGRGQMKRKQMTEQRPEQAEVIFKKETSNLGGQNHLKEEQTGEQPSDQRSHGYCSLKHTNGQGNNNGIKGWESCECGKDQTTADETQHINNRLKYGQTESLCLTSVSEWSLPEPHRLFPQVQASLSWNVATIMTCSTVWSICVDSSPTQHFQENKRPVKKPDVKNNSPCEVPQYAQSELTESEPSMTEADNTAKPQIHGLFTNTDHDLVTKAEEDLNCSRSEMTQRKHYQYVIPRIYRLDYQQGPDQTESSSQSAPEHKTTTVPWQSETSPAAPPNTSLMTMKTWEKDIDTSLSHDIAPHSITTIKPTETDVQEKDKKPGEEREKVTLVDMNDSNMQQRLRLSEYSDDVHLEGSKMVDVKIPDIKPNQDEPTEKPKYTTINYGDPSIKQTYKPKIIRFTDTFTF